MAASRNSSCAPRGPRRQSRTDLRIRLRWANSIYNPLALVPRLLEELGVGQRSDEVAGILIDIPRDLALQAVVGRQRQE